MLKKTEMEEMTGRLKRKMNLGQRDNDDETDQ